MIETDDPVAAVHEFFERPGRATVIMERRDGRRRAVHTRFSLAPGTPPTTHGRRD